MQMQKGNSYKKLIRLLLISSVFIFLGMSNSMPSQDRVIREAGSKVISYKSIQAAINDSSDGDTILVRDGIYRENIDFLGKAITVKSANGASSTVINGRAKGSVVTFSQGENYDARISGFTIENGSNRYGGGIYCSNAASPKISNCIISSNTAARNGGGFYCSISSSPVITNCTISNNLAKGNGGGIACDSSSPIISNSTISGNLAKRKGGGVYCSNSSSLEVLNSILWGDMAVRGSNEIHLTGSSIEIDYSDIQGGKSTVYRSSWEGKHNIDDDPLFVDPRAATESPSSGGNYHIRENSPCIDTGTKNNLRYTYLPYEDIDGDLRLQGTSYDMGSDEALHLINGSFEYGKRIPDSWKGGNLTSKDRCFYKEPCNGRRSFMMIGSGKDKYIRQVINISGDKGDVYTMSGWSRAQNPDPKGGFYGVQVRIFYNDSTVANYKVSFAKKTQNWQKRKKSFTVSKSYKKIEVYVRYERQQGKTWFDDIRLVKTPECIEGWIPQLLLPYANEDDIWVVSPAWSDNKKSPWGRVHWGVDFLRKEKEARIQAVASGTVRHISLFFLESIKKWQVNIAMNTTSGAPTIGYAFECFAPTYEQGKKQLENIFVREGDEVKAGDLIGILLYFKNLDFGTATLHFGLGESGGDICPEPYFTEKAIAVILQKLHIWHPGYKICYF